MDRERISSAATSPDSATGPRSSRSSCGRRDRPIRCARTRSGSMSTRSTGARSSTRRRRAAPPAAPHRRSPQPSARLAARSRTGRAALSPSLFDKEQPMTRPSILTFASVAIGACAVLPRSPAAASRAGLAVDAPRGRASRSRRRARRREAPARRWTAHARRGADRAREAANRAAVREPSRDCLSRRRAGLSLERRVRSTGSTPRPEQVSDIALQPGEALVSVAAGRHRRAG